MSSFEEFSVFGATFNRIWNVDFDMPKLKIWHTILNGLEVPGLIKTLETLAPISHFPPTIHQIVEKYAELKRLWRERKIEEQSRLITAQADKQYKCIFCRNTGFVEYSKFVDNMGDYYQYVCRCSCYHGKDLNKFSEKQLTQNDSWLDPRTGKNKNVYIPEIKDVMTDEEIEILKAKRIAERESRRKMTPEEIMELKKKTAEAMAI